MLSQSFADIWNDELQQKLRKGDREVYENPDTIGACTFITTLNAQSVGMASYDPRQAPEIGIVGYNFILPKFQGRGYGKMQIEEILRRLRQMGIKRAVVTTSEHPCFIPAQRTYLACGFKETKRYKTARDPRYNSIDYEIQLQGERR